ncbi:DinB family protein [Paenibacillus sp. N1-5-1-14]|uniref:DinB family protein n=1 Tax=Paenibacillus radicibacter TaxID=2972488 RepID=UPI0021597F2C|nr:DinB family protein [Paenibacillus radicibacter]MCR8642824.1 DinB family protein [Paenibacillus radicibacter]
MSHVVIMTAQKVRGMVLRTVQSIPEEVFDIQPAGFNNTIRWNVGHIVNSLERFCAASIPLNSNLPATYNEQYGTGSRPSAWTEAGQSKDELLEQLSAQLNAISEASAEVLETAFPEPVELGPMKLNTVAELINFAVIHEALHLGTIKALAAVTSVK